MIDRNHLDQAGLSALGWLDETERADFDHECLINQDLRATRAEVCDLVAAVAATAPPAMPPPQALAGIFARLSGSEVVVRSAPTSGWLPRFAARGLPWAAAAGFALLAAWMSWRSHETASRWREFLEFGSSTRSSDGRSRRVTPGLDNPAGDGTNVSGNAEAPRPPGSRNFPSRFFSNRPGDPEVRLQQDTERLRNEVSKLRAAENARQQLPSGISDLRVVEMLPPGAKHAPEKSELLSSRVAEAIANGMHTAAPASPDPKSAATPSTPEPIRLRGQGSNPSGDIVIEEGLVNLGTLNLHPDAQVVHKNFPTPDDYARLGLTPLDDHTVYDGQGGLWHRSAGGTEWIGQKAPDNWTPPDPDEGASGLAPPLRPAPTPLRTPASSTTTTPDPAAEPGVPYALPVLDQQGRGTLIVQNLPPAPDGEFYHLWMMDPRFSGPVSVGVLPPMETAYDHFGFDLGTPGFVPTGYLLTLERAGAADVPSGKIVLQGP